MRTINYLLNVALIIFTYSIAIIEKNTHIGTLFLVLAILHTLVVLFYILNIKSLRTKNINLTSKLYDLDEKYIRLYNKWEILQSEKNAQDIPFTEPIKQCECGADMIKRTKYWVCSNCKKRKLIKEEE